jgi:hypothetical protein
MSKQSVPPAHFSFSNSLYDNCNLEKKNQESTGQFKWVTDNVKESKSACYVNTTPFMHKQFQSIPYNKIDIESDLRNQNRILTRCPDSRFDPTKLDNCKDCEKCNQGLPCGCQHCRQTKYENELKDCTNSNLVPEYTRINKPCNIFSGITINRFNPLIEDLQDTNKIQSNSYIGTNTRLQVKDAFKAATLFKLT